MADRPLPRETLARNLSYLMDKHGLSCAALAKKSGVSAKTVNNMQQTRFNVTLDSVDAVARVFGLTAWHLIMPNLPSDMLESKTMEQHVAKFCQLPKASRDQVDAFLDREAAFAELTAARRNG